jgi:hypothetical protein
LHLASALSILALRNQAKSNICKTVNPVFMKRRVRKIANFFAFNLLFFALYLNFIHKDKVAVADPNAQHSAAAAFSGTVLVDNPNEFLNKTEATNTSVSTKPETKTEEGNVAALKLSIN